MEMAIKCVFDKDHMIPKECCAFITPETKDFWNSIPYREKSSILRSVRDNPKHHPVLTTKPSFTRKVSKAEIESLFRQCLALKEHSIAEDAARSEDSTEDASILVDSAAAKNPDPANLRGVLSIIFKQTSNSKTKVYKAFTSAK